MRRRRTQPEYTFSARTLPMYSHSRVIRYLSNRFYLPRLLGKPQAKQVWSIVAVCCVSLVAYGQTVFLDFNSPGQYTGNFNAWNDAGGNNGGNYDFTESSTAGVGGGGAVAVVASTDTTATYKTGSWDFSTNAASLTLSVWLKSNGQVSGNKVQLGILNSTNNGLNGNAGVAFESFRFIPQTPGNLWSVREQFRTGGTTTEATLGTATITVGNWYRFMVTLTNVAGASGSYNASCAIYDYGVDGLTPGTNVITFPTFMAHTGQTDVTVPNMWPALRAFQNAGVDAWDNFLVYQPSSRPVFTLPLTDTKAPTGQPATFLGLADGPGSISYAWYTNKTLVSGATVSSYTTPALTSAYTNIMVVAQNGNGSVSSSAAINVFTPSPATLTNSPASTIQTTQATLNGEILSTGGATPDVTLFYGTADGATNPGAWANSIDLGRQTGVFSQTVTGLTQNTTYYFTARAVNGAGTNWGIPSLNFATLPITVAVVTNFPPTNVRTTSAILNGQVLSTGNETPSITLYYGPSDGGTTPAAWAFNYPLGTQSSAFAQVISGLASNQTYFFTAEAVNSAGISWARPSGSFTTPVTNPPVPPFAAVLTQHNDNNRSGANLQESLLTTNNVNTNLFGLVFTRPVDDQVYAQPLVMTNVNIPGKGMHNIVIVATVNDSVYAFDADDGSVTAPYWHNSLIGPNARAPRNSDMTGACGGNYQDFSGNIGIVGTPVIDPASGTIYLVARTLESGNTFVQRLHALDVTTGVDRIPPTVIGATYPGFGDGSMAGVLSFDPQRANQRPGLALANGLVYIAWSSHCDWGPYHGWVIGYDTSTLRQVCVFNDTPNGYNGGIWMSGQAPAVDAAGNLYLSTGNGTVDTSGGANRGESFLRLTPSGTNLTMTSWFTPADWQVLENGDIDLGSGGLLLIPGTNLLFGGGKEGIIYLVNADNMGGLSGASTDTNIVQHFQVTTDELHGGPVWWDGPGGPFAYVWPSSVLLQQYRFNKASGQFSVPAYARSSTAAPNGQPGGILTISANGNQAGSGIVWAVHQLTGDANQSVRPGILHAYDAANVAHELWNSEQLSARDGVGNFAKFVPPTVANGKVYLATFSQRLNVYGLLPVAAPVTLTISQPSGSQPQLRWPAGLLQSAPAVTGPYTNVPSATSPFSITPSNGVQFFRVKVQ